MIISREELKDLVRPENIGLTVEGKPGVFELIETPGKIEVTFRWKYLSGHPTKSNITDADIFNIIAYPQKQPISPLPIGQI